MNTNTTTGQMIEAYPLHWPMAYTRTPAYKRKNSQFKNTLGAARDFLKSEVRKLGATNLIISTNIPTKQNGDLYADYSRYKLDDPGVAIYFNYNGKEVALCCDQYGRVWENIQALAKAIEAIRGLERWGVSDFLDRAFTGFQQLPESTTGEQNIWEVLGLDSKPESSIVVHQAYKSKAKTVHPD
ncbi:MAG: hypothetical protein ACTHKV_13885, partial [Flavipsychrobacter sp.]